MNRPGILLPGCDSSPIRPTETWPSLSIARPRYTLLLTLVLTGFLHSALAQQQFVSAGELPDIPPSQVSVPPLTGGITGTVTDLDGDSIPGAIVILAGQGSDYPSPGQQQAIAGGDGNFAFANVAPGSFSITVTAPGFATLQTTGSLQPGQQDEIPQISMTPATAINVEVTASEHDVAQDQIAVEEKQRVLGVIPNFYVTYDPHPVPLSPRQKFGLAWKISVDPVNIALTGVVAGVQQSQDTFNGYGQGTQGYAKRFGAAYGGGFIETMLGGAILPTLFKQDPRYFYKGTGRVASRAFYAIANAVICKGDNGHWQTNYSNIVGNLAAGGISNLYYAPDDRSGIKLTVESTLIGLAAGAGGNLFQEFLIRKLTPHARHPIGESQAASQAE